MASLRRSLFALPVWRGGISVLSGFVLLLLPGCTYLSVLSHAHSEHALPAQTFRFHDGGEAIYFSLTKTLSLPTAVADAQPAQTYMFVVSGSDCTSMQYFLPQYFRGLEGESGKLRIFILHKRFIEALTWGRIAGCSDAFIRADHPSRWIADQTEFIQSQLAQSVQAGGAPRRVVIVGISEGGDIVPLLARNIPGVTHAVILANGGMNPLDAYRLQASRHGLSDALVVFAALDQPAPLDQDAPEQRIHGRSYRYWAELRDLRHAEVLANLRVPVMVAMGEDDAMVPIESLRYLREHFASLGKTNLTVMSFPHADHALEGPAGSQLPDFWFALDKWLEK